MTPIYPLRLFEVWQEWDPNVMEANLGALANGLNAIARMRPYQVTRSNIGLSIALNGLRFTQTLITPFVRIRDANGNEYEAVVEADRATLSHLGVLLQAAAVPDAALVPGDALASVAALAKTLNDLLTALQDVGSMDAPRQCVLDMHLNNDDLLFTTVESSDVVLESTLLNDTGNINAGFV
jgi:hypothetical protein